MSWLSERRSTGERTILTRMPTLCADASQESNIPHTVGKCGEERRRQLQGMLGRTEGDLTALSDDDLRGQLRGLRSSQGGGGAQVSSAEGRGQIRQAFRRDWPIEEIEDLTQIGPRAFLLDLDGSRQAPGEKTEVHTG